ncbi:MAG TPA: hypothetical protein VFP65_15690 [Anaeromyxobacteraceae bacterium]|nr:hypothetical protein [Anaeromyxobacteraceae bacterium]
MKRSVLQPSRNHAAHVDSADRSPLYRGYTKATFSLRPDQIASLRAVARARADSAGEFRPDVSAVVREAIDSWLSRPRARR